jgi:hypothetical protein
MKKNLEVICCKMTFDDLVEFTSSFEKNGEKLFDKIVEEVYNGTNDEIMTVCKFSKTFSKDEMKNNGGICIVETIGLIRCYKEAV